ncbi:hypothetical protein BLNAU_10511 [Blattamonas nauphoetae]|uniref:Protein kinase domain-containing protein n=1 Tax=Blattamonas nauphoetae TaxID=2049346 RepID=A0ABQ9XT10_9EUKA|nr:hypothetical protein BLNAU_10511 [Blattamonas nauphoetae]
MIKVVASQNKLPQHHHLLPNGMHPMISPNIPHDLPQLPNNYEIRSILTTPSLGVLYQAVRADSPLIPLSLHRIPKSPHHSINGTSSTDSLTNIELFHRMSFVTQLRHPCLIQTFDILTDPSTNSYIIATEDLSIMLPVTDVMSTPREKELLFICRSLVSGMCFCRDIGINIRNLPLSRVLLTTTGVKLLDYFVPHLDTSWNSDGTGTGSSESSIGLNEVSLVGRVLFFLLFRSNPSTVIPALPSHFSSELSIFLHTTLFSPSATLHDLETDPWLTEIGHVPLETKHDPNPFISLERRRSLPHLTNFTPTPLINSTLTFPLLSPTHSSSPPPPLLGPNSFVLSSSLSLSHNWIGNPLRTSPQLSSTFSSLTQIPNSTNMVFNAPTFGSTDLGEGTHASLPHFNPTSPLLQDLRMSSPERGVVGGGSCGVDWKGDVGGELGLEPLGKSGGGQKRSNRTGSPTQHKDPKIDQAEPNGKKSTEKEQKDEESMLETELDEPDQPNTQTCESERKTNTVDSSDRTEAENEGEEGEGRGDDGKNKGEAQEAENDLFVNRRKSIVVPRLPLREAGIETTDELPASFQARPLTHTSDSEAPFSISDEMFENPCGGTEGEERKDGTGEKGIVGGEGRKKSWPGHSEFDECDCHLF